MYKKIDSSLKRLFGILLVFSIVIVISANWCQVFAQEQEFGLDDFNLKTECGINGYVKSDASIPLKLYITSKKDDFKGKVSVLVVSDEWNFKVSYEEEVTLPKGEEKEVDIHLSNGTDSNYYKILLVDEKGKQRYSKICKSITSIENNTALVGVLSDSYKNLKYMNGVELSASYGIQTQTIPLDKDSFPENIDALNELSYLIIDDYNSGELNEKQYAALKQWVENGGILYLSLGKEYKKTLELFQDDFLQGTIEGMETTTFGLNSDMNAPTVKADTVKLDETGFDRVISVLSRTCMYTKKKGKGSVMLIGFDLSKDPIISWSAKDDLAKDLYGYFPDTITQMEKNIDSKYQSNYTPDSSLFSFYHGMKPPSVIVFGLIFILYVLFIGPVLYVYLKKKDKREWMWVGIPLGALCFTFLIFICSFATKVYKPVSSSITLFSNDGENASIYSKIISPKNGDISVQYKDNVSDVSVDTFSGYSVNTSSYTIQHNAKGYLFTKNQSKAFSDITNTATLKNSAMTKGFDCDVVMDLTSVKGEITNVSGKDLNHVIVYYLGNYYCVDRLKDQECITLDDSTKWKSVKADAVDHYFIQPEKKGHHFFKSNYDFEIMDAANLQDFVYNRYIVNMESAQVVVFGIVDHYSNDYVNGNIEECNKAIIMNSYSDDKMKGNNYLTDLNGRYIQDNEEIWYEGSDGLCYGFEEGEFIYNVEEDNGMAGQSDMGGPVPVSLVISEPIDDSLLKIEAYNFDSRRYDAIFTNQSTEVKDHLESYVRNGTLKLRYTSVKGRIDEGKGKGFKMPRLDLITSYKEAEDAAN